MAAVAHASPVELRRLVLVRTTPVVRPPRTASLPTVFRRRRLVALMVVVSAGVALVLAMQGLFASVSGASGSGPDRSPAPAAVYVVQPGDTFWGIARQLDPGGDPRPLVARLVAAHGGASLVAGERLALPAAA